MNVRKPRGVILLLTIAVLGTYFVNREASESIVAPPELEAAARLPVALGNEDPQVVLEPRSGPLGHGVPQAHIALDPTQPAPWPPGPGPSWWPRSASPTPPRFPRSGRPAGG